MTILVSSYPSKKNLKEQIGKPLDFTETSAFGPEYKSNGTFVVAHRPSITKTPGREFFASVTMENGLIKKVE